MQVLPFAHAQVGKKVRFAEFPALALRAEALPLVVHGVPDFQQREKIRLRIGETFVRGGRGIFLVEWSLARILDAQAGGDDEQFARGVFMLRLQQHPAERRVNRQPRKIVAELRELALLVERAEFLQQLVAAINRRGWWRIHEGKRLDVAEPIRLHAQDDFGEVRTLDFRLRVLRALREILLGIQPDAHAVLHATAAAFALVGAALRNGFNWQSLGPRARFVAADARQSGVDDVADAGDGQRGLRDVRGDDHLALVVIGHGRVLVRRRQLAVQRQDDPAARHG